MPWNKKRVTTTELYDEDGELVSQLVRGERYTFVCTKDADDEGFVFVICGIEAYYRAQSGQPDDSDDEQALFIRILDTSPSESTSELRCEFVVPPLELDAVLLGFAPDPARKGASGREGYGGARYMVANSS